jgi:hypothetical protein
VTVPTSVYRYLDADGVLIYVGITNRGVQRQAEHVAHSKWWRFVCTQDVEHYDDRPTAERRERLLIEKHQPPFNVTHNAEHKRRLTAYLKHTGTAIEPCGHCYGCLLAASPDPEDAQSEDAICRLLRPLEEDEDAAICSVCNRPECAYQDGVDVGMEEGRWPDMARIRSIKPQAFTSESLARCSVPPAGPSPASGPTATTTATARPTRASSRASSGPSTTT